MDELWKAFAEQVPALAVLVFLTIKFLTHLGKRDEACNEALKSNTTIVGRVCGILDRIETRLDRDDTRRIP